MSSSALAFNFKIVITGYNTDIEFDGVIYHVQTEDKGASTPVIMSLVYDRGTILASKRSPYDDLINGTVDEDAVAERLQRQHKLICAAVSAGRIEDLKAMSARNLKAASAKRSGKKRSAKAESETDTVEIVAESPEIPPVPRPEGRPPWPVPKDQTNESADLIPNTIPSIHLNGAFDLATGDLSPIAKPGFEPMRAELTVPAIGDSFIEEVSIVTDEPSMILPVEAIKVVSDLAGTDRLESNKLSIDIVGESRFRGGEKRELCLMVCRGSTRKVVPRAEVMVKVLGSDFHPVIYHTVTDTNGVATVEVKVPRFQSGRASMIARAISDGEEVEIRSAIAHG